MRTTNKPPSFGYAILKFISDINASMNLPKPEQVPAYQPPPVVPQLPPPVVSMPEPATIVPFGSSKSRADAELDSRIMQALARFGLILEVPTVTALDPFALANITDYVIPTAAMGMCEYVYKRGEYRGTSCNRGTMGGRSRCYRHVETSMATKRASMIRKRLEERVAKAQPLIVGAN